MISSSLGKRSTRHNNITVYRVPLTNEFAIFDSLTALFRVAQLSDTWATLDGTGGQAVFFTLEPRAIRIHSLNTRWPCRTFLSLRRGAELGYLMLISLKLWNRRVGGTVAVGGNGHTVRWAFLASVGWVIRGCPSGLLKLPRVARALMMEIGARLGT